MDPLIGQTLSHYRIVEKIGAGGMGEVYRAHDTRLERDVALKVLPSGALGDEAARKLFRREALALSKLNHPNIATVHDFDSQEGVDFLVMELVSGETLAERVARGPLSEKEVGSFGEQLAGGLEAAHRQGVLHRDIKPSNLRVTTEGRLKILDFGLARLVRMEGVEGTTMTATATVAGTTPYMAPEQLRGEGLDERTDIWGAGAALYELACGVRAYPQKTAAHTIQSILNEAPNPPREINPGISEDLEWVILKCLEKDPAERYQSARELAVDLRRVARQPALGRGTVAGTPRRRDRRAALRAVVAAGIAAVVVVAVGALLLLRAGRQAPAPARPAHSRSEIAVLPFQNLNAEGPNAYFAGGLHDELLTQLSKVASLKVISRTSVMGYQGTSKPLKQIADELGVGSVVEGSVQLVGGRLRVNVQLIDATTDEHLWAERYDRTLDDAFAIQSEVAQQIVAAVGATLTSAEQGRLTAAPTANAEAYRLYLQGREYARRPSLLRQDQETAQQLFERALALDPNFTLAHAALSQVHGWMYWLRWDPSAARAAHQREEAEAALRLAPDLPQAHLAMGLAYYWGRLDYRRGLDEFGIALKGLPNDAELWSLVAAVHRRLGNWNEVLAAYEKNAQLDPRDALLYRVLGDTYVFLRRYPDAVRAYDQALGLVPDLHAAAIGKGRTYVRWHGQLDSLRAALSRLPRDADLGGGGDLGAVRADVLLWERNADSLLQMLRIARVDVFDGQGHFLPGALYTAWAYQLRGDRAAARAAFDSARVRLNSALRELPDDYRVHAARGMTLAGLGRRDEALREAGWLKQSIIHRRDAFWGPALAEDRARILAQAGDAEGALDEIERLLAGPSWLTVHTLRLDPLWDPIRDHPRFKALLAKYGSRAAG